MGSKFLGGSGGSLAELQTGLFPINVATVIAQNLANNLPVRTDGDKMLTSGLIQMADCDFEPLTMPLGADLDVGGNGISDVKEMLLESNASPSTPPADMLTLYTSGDKLRYKDDTTTTYQLATTADIGSYLLLAGGTMSGPINMGAQELSNVGAIRSSSPNLICGGNILNTDIFTHGTLIGTDARIVAGDGGTAVGFSSGCLTDGATAIGSFSFSNAVNGVAVGCNAGVYSLGGIAIGHTARSAANYAHAIGYNVYNDIANSLLLDCTANIRPAANTCSLGTAAAPFGTAYLAGSITGSTNTRTVDNIVSNTGSSVSGNLASLSGITGKVITDSGLVAASVVIGPASAVTGRIATYSDTTGKLIADSGVLAASVVVGPASVVSGNLTSYSGTTGKLVADSGVVASSVVVGPASVVTGNLASYNGTTGKLVADSGVLAASVVTGPASAVDSQVALFNGTTGKVITNGATAIGTLGALTLANTTASSSTTTGSLISAGGLGVAGNVYSGGNMVAATGTIYGRATQPAVLSKCMSSAAKTVIDNLGYGASTCFSTPLGSLVYAANQSNVSMTLDFTAFYDCTAVTTYLAFGFYLNGASKLTSPQVTVAGTGMVNFKIRVDAAGGMTAACILYKNGASPALSFATPTTWTVSSTNTTDFIVYFNSNSSTSSVTITQAMLTTIYQT